MEDNKQGLSISIESEGDRLFSQFVRLPESVSVNEDLEIWKKRALAAEAKLLDSWISVDERLPDFDVPVLGICFGSLGAFARVDEDSADGWLWAKGSNYLDDIRNYEADDDYQVTHWMPMPQLPKGE